MDAISITNTDAQTAAWLRGIKELLTDPANAGDLADIRSRKLMLAMAEDGNLLLVRLTQQAQERLAKAVLGKSVVDWTHISN
jgi:hypothetical protein